MNETELQESMRTDLRTMFASDLGWKPGQWPSPVVIYGIVMERWQVVKDGEGEIIGVIYRQEPDKNPAEGWKVMVYND